MVAIFSEFMSSARVCAQWRFAWVMVMAELTVFYYNRIESIQLFEKMYGLEMKNPFGRNSTTADIDPGNCLSRTILIL